MNDSVIKLVLDELKSKDEVNINLIYAAAIINHYLNKKRN